MDMVDKKTGQIVPIADEQAAAAFQSGEYGIPQGARLPVVTPSGTVGTVNADEALQALSKGVGHRIATPGQIHEAQMESRYGGGLGNTLAAGGLGVAKGAVEMTGLPFEASVIPAADALLGSKQEVDPVTGKIRMVSGGDRTREALSALAALHPTASGAGQLAGTIGAMALGDEFGLINKLGRGAEAIGGMGARAVAEGGAIGLQNAMDEAALGDHELRAEQVLAAIGHGAIISGGGAAAFGLLGKAFQRGEAGRFARQIRPQDVDALAEAHFGYAPKGLGDLYAKGASLASGGDVDAIRKLIGSSEARRIAVYDSEAIQTEAARMIRQHGDDILQADKLIAEEAKGSLKASYVERAVAKGNEEEVTRYGAGKLQQIIDGAQAALDSGGGYTKSIEHIAAQAYRVRDAVMSGDNAVAFIALDGLKRDMQQLTRNAYRGAQAIADPIDRRAALTTAKWMDEASNGLRLDLEDTRLWGKAAEDQKAINAAWSKQIDASVRFHRSLTTEVGRDPTNPYLQAKGMDPSKVTTYVRGLTNPDKDLTHQAVKDYLQGSRDLADAIGKSYDLPPEKLMEIDRLKKASLAFEKQIDKGTESLVLANQYAALKASDSPIGGALSLAGGLIGGPIGAAAGAIVGALTTPAKTVAQLAAIERLGKEVDMRIDLGLDRFFSGKKPPGRPPSVKMLEGKGGPRETFADSVGTVRELAADPMKLSERIGKSIDPIAKGAPRIAAALATRAALMTQNLANEAPKMKTGNALDPTKEPHIFTDMEMRQWAREAAVRNSGPDAITDSMARGTLTPGEVRVFQQEWPKHYLIMQEKIKTKLQTKTVNRSKRVVLQTLFPGSAVDQDMDAGSFALFAAAHAQGPAPGEKPMGKPLNVRMEKSYATPSQSIGGR